MGLGGTGERTYGWEDLPAEPNQQQWWDKPMNLYVMCVDQMRGAYLAISTENPEIRAVSWSTPEAAVGELVENNPGINIGHIIRVSTDRAPTRQERVRENDFGGDTVRFKREHPANPEEAFTASSRNRFSVPHIMRMPIQRDPVAGELQAETVGVENRLVFMPGEHGAVRVWKRPEKGRLYALGADCAQGIDVTEGLGQSDPDYSAGQMLDRDTGEQVAVLRARLMPGETGRYMAAFARWYNMAQICGERNPGGGGISMLEAILNADYPASLIYHRSLTADQQPQVRSDRIGWDTTGVSRPILIGMLDEAIRQGAITVRDPVTQQELLTFIIRPNGKPEAQAGCHDDLVISLALAMVVIERMPRPIPIALHGVKPPELGRYGQAARGDPPRGQNVRLR